MHWIKRTLYRRLWSLTIHTFKTWHKVLLVTITFMMSSIQDNKHLSISIKSREKSASSITLNSFSHEVNHRFSILGTSLYYGNTGCGVFTRGIQNKKRFWQKINFSQMKSLNFENWSNCELSKIGHHFRK